MAKNNNNELSKGITFFFVCVALSMSVGAQNVSINALTLKSGIVKKGKIVLFQITINNTDATELVGIYKLKVQINVADSIVSIAKSGHNLPTGWEIISTIDGSITLSNGKDIVAPSDARNIFIALVGKKVGGPVIVSGQLRFSNGVVPGTEPGSLKGDNPADNLATSSCQVKK